MRSRIEIDVDARPQAVFELARDIASWPSLLPHYQQVTIRSRAGEKITADMRALRRVAGPLAIPVAWRTEQWADASDPTDLQLQFLHVGGFTRGMDVTWHITPLGDTAARVAIEHDFARRLPLPGSMGQNLVPRFVDRFFVRPIASRTLATFKQLAEEQV